MRLGMGEILVVLLIALFVLGPDQLPTYARKLGNALKVFRNAANETTEGIRENIIEPLNEAQQPLRDALEPVEELQHEIDRNVKDVEKSLKEVTSPISSKKPETKDETPASPEKAKKPAEPETSEAPPEPEAGEPAEPEAGEPAEPEAEKPAEPEAENGSAQQPGEDSTE